MIEKPTVTFETKCWENDWEFILKTDYLKKSIEKNNFPFKERLLYINNVQNPQEVIQYAKKLVQDQVLTNFYLVDNYAEKALKFFKLSKESFGKGYVYSISELVSIYLCKTDFLLHFAGDSFVPKRVDWVPKALEVIQKNDQVKVINLLWDNQYTMARREAFEETEDFFVSYGFTDQCYLVQTKDFRQPIYSEKNPESERYPVYGGELFEKRVDAWLRNHHYQRLTFKHGTYLHRNFPRNPYIKKIRLFLAGNRGAPGRI